MNSSALARRIVVALVLCPVAAIAVAQDTNPMAAVLQRFQDHVKDYVPESAPIFRKLIATYRFAGHALILRDSTANLVVDVLEDAVPRQ